MGARQKLNVANIVGCVLVAAMIGALCSSVPIFAIAALVLIAGAIESGDIRPTPRQR